MAFYKDCLTVAATAVKFYDVYIWGKREYDRQGNLISVENADAPYNYSVDDVVQWVEDKYNVDLNKKPRWAMMNRSPNPIPHYMLRFIDNDGQRIVYSIDARDGSLIYENIAGEEKTYKDVRDWWRNPDGTKVKRRWNGFSIRLIIIGVSRKASKALLASSTCMRQTRMSENHNQ